MFGQLPEPSDYRPDPDDEPSDEEPKAPGDDMPGPRGTRVSLLYLLVSRLPYWVILLILAVVIYLIVNALGGPTCSNTDPSLPYCGPGG